MQNPRSTVLPLSATQVMRVISPEITTASFSNNKVTVALPLAIRWRSAGNRGTSRSAQPEARRQWCGVPRRTSIRPREP